MEEEERPLVEVVGAREDEERPRPRVPRVVVDAMKGAIGRID